MSGSSSRLFALPGALLSLAIASVGACGLLNAVTGGEAGSPAWWSNCALDGVCDCVGVGCVCDPDGQTCSCELDDPELDVLCEVYLADNTPGCAGDGCVCDVVGCSCFGDLCACDEGCEDGGGVTPLPQPAPLLAEASCAIDDVCSCTSQGSASCACRAGQCVCLAGIEGSSCAVQAVAAPADCEGATCACTADRCTCNAGSECVCGASCSPTTTLCGDSECAIGGEPSCPFDCRP
jgi:hypothetical protein